MYSVREGKLRCVYYFSPTPRVVWEKEGKPIKSSRVQLKNQKVIIRDATFEDGGNYKCKGSNSVLEFPKVKSFKLVIQGRLTCRT